MNLPEHVNDPNRYVPAASEPEAPSSPVNSDGTTEGITSGDVALALMHLGIYNPKPYVRLEETVSGHEIVAISRRISKLEDDIRELKDR